MVPLRVAMPILWGTSTMNNDYTAGWMAHQRHDDYLREVERDELAAAYHAAQAEAVPGPTIAETSPPVRHWWGRVFSHIHAPHFATHGHRP